MSDQLIRFWIELDRAVQAPIGFRLGCGVTAFSEADALALLRTVWPWPASDPVVTRTIAGIEREDLERNHVVPNIGDVSVRGVWFPNFGRAAAARAED